MKTIRITLEELEDGQPIKDSLPCQLEFEKYESYQEQGLNRAFGRTAETFGRCTDIESNGQRRMNIKLWTGCATFESFDKGNA